MNRLENLKNNPVVRAAIQRNKDIKRTKKSTAIGYGIASLLIPGGFFAKLGGKAIGQAFKKAGSIGNTKKADTVGNRFRQSQAIMGKPPKDSPFNTRTSMAKQDEKRPASLNNPMLGAVSGTAASLKYYRTLTKAVEQGPSKFFSSGRSAKTGITAGKRSKGGLSNKELRKESDIYKMRVDNDSDLPVFDNRSLLKKTLQANKMARTTLGARTPLGKRSSGNNPKTGVRAGKRVFGKEQSDGYAYGYDYGVKENSVNATAYTAYNTIKGKKNINKANRAQKELSKGLPKGQIGYDPKHVREKFFQNKSLTKYDVKLVEDVYPSNIIKKARSLLKKK